MITPASGGPLNIIWDTESGQYMESGETLEVPTIIYNANRYEMRVHLSILSNYTMIPENDDYTTIEPCPDNTWSAKLNETDFILEGNEKRIIPLIIKSPKSAEDGEVYGLYLGMYVENYYFPKINDNGTYVFAAIIEYNVSSDDPNDNSNNSNHDIIKNPTENSKQERLDEDIKIEDYYLEIAGSILIITIVVVIFIIYKRP